MGIKLQVIFAACVLFCIGITGAAAGCSLSNIVVTQHGIGEWAHGQPVYAVTVRNTCNEPQCGVKVACGGFQTTLETDPAKFRRADRQLCLLNGGNTIMQGADVAFSYAWSEQFKFAPVSSTLNCK